VEEEKAEGSGVKPHPSTILNEQFFSQQHPYLTCLIAGLTTGIGVALTVEWNEYFEVGRDVPVWETILVGSVSTTIAMCATYLLLNLASKISSK
tara:strand:+ start:849 stop:1130 length:282 start_codon:yes stop_codon:yes gene_type:complete